MRPMSISPLLSLFTAGVLSLSACNLFDGKDIGGEENPSKTPSYSLTAVDPYIEEAVFYADLNNNGQMDVGEPRTEVGDEIGQYVFYDFTPSEATLIRALEKGRHLGVDFNLSLEGTAPAGSTHLVLNPATTAVSQLNIAAEDLAAILNQFKADIGIEISAAMLDKDPLADILAKEVTELTEEELARVRAQLIIAGVQRIMQGSEKLQQLKASEFIASATQGQTAENMVYQIANFVVQGVKSGVNKATIQGFLADSGYNYGVSQGAPAFNTAALVNTGVTIMNRIVEAGYEACNTYNQSHQGADWNGADNIAAIQAAINPLLSQIATWGPQVGKRYYAASIRKALDAMIVTGGIIKSQMSQDADLKAGFDCPSGYFVIGSDNRPSCTP